MGFREEGSTEGLLQFYHVSDGDDNPQGWLVMGLNEIKHRKMLKLTQGYEYVEKRKKHPGRGHTAQVLP